MEVRKQFYQIIKNVSFAGKLGDDVDHGLGLHDLVQSNDGRVKEASHDLDLPRNLPQVVRIQVVLVHDLDRDLRPGQTVNAEPNDRKVSLPEEARREVVEADPKQPRGPVRLFRPRCGHRWDDDDDDDVFFLDL